MASDFNLFAKGIINQFPTYSVAHVTTGSVTVATATITIGGAFVNKSGISGSVYAAYKDLWERLNDGQIGLIPPLTQTEINALSGIDDGVQVVNKTNGHLETCIAGSFTHPGEEDGFVRNNPTTVTTTDNTQTTIHTTALDDNEVYVFDAEVLGETSDFVTMGGFIITCTVRRHSGGVAQLLGSVTESHVGKDSGASSWSVTFTVSGNNLLTSVTGANGTTINWKAFVKYSKF